MRRFLIGLIGIVGLIGFAGCSSKPTNVVTADSLPVIYPDYAGVTIPAGIAPLDFNMVDAEVDVVDVTIRGSKGGELHVNGEWAAFDIGD